MSSLATPPDIGPDTSPDMAAEGRDLSLAAMARAARAAGDAGLFARALQPRLDQLAPFNALAQRAPCGDGAADALGPVTGAGVGSGAAPLFGVPVTVKDSYDTAGLRSTASYPPLADHIPAQDAALVARLRETGAVILAKTNLAPLCGDIQTRSPLFGTACNPWDVTRTPGGSGGGGAVAVLRGASRLDLGSDLAGSLRIPASFCGLAALKAGAGRFDMAGHRPPLGDGPPPPFQAGGFLARDSTDLAQAFAALTGAAAPAPLADPGQALDLGQVTGLPLPLCPRTAAGLARALGWLAAAGHRISAAPLDFSAAWLAYGMQLTAPSARFVTRAQRLGLRALALAAGARRPLRRAQLLGLAGQPLAPALAAEQACRATIEAHLARHEALICPVTAVAAFAHLPPPRLPLVLRRIPIGAGQSLPYQEAGLGLTVPFSLSGHPVVVVPIDRIAGLPVGLQIIGRIGDEAGLLALARQIEAVFDRHRPPLWRQYLTQHLTQDPPQAIDPLSKGKTYEQ